jgi:hypothetical protein
MGKKKEKKKIKKRKVNDIVRVSGKHKMKSGDKALLVKSKKSGFHFRKLTKY